MIVAGWIAACWLAGPAVPVPSRVPAAKTAPAVKVTAPRLAPDLRRSTPRDDAGEFVPLPDGKLRYEDPDGRFVAIIDEDGSVEFRPGTRIDFDRPGQQLQYATDGFVGALLRPPGQRDRPERENPPPDSPSERAFAAIEIGPNESGGRGYGPAPILLSAGGRFAGIGTPTVSKAAKAEVLAKTEALRERLRRQVRDEAWTDAERRQLDEVRRVWNSEVLTAQARRRKIFKLWDELAPDPATGLSEEDRTRRDRAIALQRRIERLAAMLAPEGSADAFSEAELKRLNAGRKSTRAFEPYPKPRPPQPGAPGAEPTASGAPRIAGR